jgi:hypothetical protein
LVNYNQEMSTVVLADVSMEKFKRPAGWCMWLKLWREEMVVR